MTSQIRWGLSLCLVASLFSGCSSSSDNPETFEASGKVTKGGQPVSGATVTFVPQAADGRAASGITDASGAYTLTTFESGDGALAGSYKVTITKFPGAAAPTTTGGGTASAEDLDAIYGAMQAQGQSVNAPPQTNKGAPVPKNELDDRFSNPQTSGLEAEIKPDGTNTFDFEVQ